MIMKYAFILSTKISMPQPFIRPNILFRPGYLDKKICWSWNGSVSKLKKASWQSNHFRFDSYGNLMPANVPIYHSIPRFLRIECCQNFQNRLKFRRVRTKFLKYCMNFPKFVRECYFKSLTFRNFNRF